MHSNGKCQKIKRFSDNAVANGAYSAVVTDDIVMFRFCPERRCSSSAEFGCTAGYGEHAMDLKDYLRIMMYYQAEKAENICMFCAVCQYGYGNRRYRNLDNQTYTSGYDDDYYGADDDFYDDQEGSSYQYSSGECEAYSSLCKSYSSYCDGYNDDGSSYNHLDYFNYFDCVDVEYENVLYYLKPTCDNNNNIVMGVFYDKFCSQYAGKDVSVAKVTGITFSRDVFSNASTSECLACDYNENPPYFNSNNLMCNNLYYKSGKCDIYFAYDIDDDIQNENSDEMCTYIENIRYGSYKETGEVTEGSMLSGEVTAGQTSILVILSLFCILLAIKACALHHEITNFLLWQLTLKGSLMSEPSKNYGRKIENNISDNSANSDYSESN